MGKVALSKALYPSMIGFGHIWTEVFGTGGPWGREGGQERKGDLERFKIRCQKLKIKKKSSWIWVLKQPQTHLPTAAKEPEVPGGCGERNQCPKSPKITQNPFPSQPSNSRLPPNSAFQANPTAPAVLPHHHPGSGSGEGETNPKPTGSKPLKAFRPRVGHESVGWAAPGEGQHKALSNQDLQVS